MTRGKLVLAAVAALVLLAGLAFQLGWFESRPGLTVHLRCSGVTGGKLFIGIAAETGAIRSDTDFDLKTACAQGQIQVEGYRREESLRIRLDRGDGNVSELSAQYGSHIHSDPRGFYAVLKITNSAPFIANGNI